MGALSGDRRRPSRALEIQIALLARELRLELSYEFGLAENYLGSFKQDFCAYVQFSNITLPIQCEVGLSSPFLSIYG